MLACYEKKILREYSKQHSDFISNSDDSFNPTDVDRARFTRLIQQIAERKKYKEFIVQYTTEKFIALKYLNSHADVTDYGLTIIHNYYKEVLKLIFTDYLPILLSIGAFVISIIALV